MRIAIHGSYYDDNFGDLLLLEIFEKWLRQMGVRNIVYPLVPHSEAKRFQTRFPTAEIGTDTIKQWDGLIYAGGGHFGDAGSHLHPLVMGKWSRRFFSRHALPAELCMWHRIPYSLIGMEVGPLSNHFVQREVQRIIDHTQSLSVRNLESQDFIHNMLNRDPDILVAPDPVLSLEPHDIPEEATRLIDSLLCKVKGRILLGIHHPNDFLGDEPGTRVTRQALLAYLRIHPEVTPVVFSDNGKAYTNQLAAQIEAATGQPCLSFPFLGVWETCALIARFHAVLTTKLHVSITAYVMGVHCESFFIHPKIPRFFNQIGLSNQCSALKTMTYDQAIKKINRSMSQGGNTEILNSTTRRHIQQESQRHQDLLTHLLDNRHWQTA